LRIDKRYPGLDSLQEGTSTKSLCRRRGALSRTSLLPEPGRHRPFTWRHRRGEAPIFAAQSTLPKRPALPRYRSLNQPQYSGTTRRQQTLVLSLTVKLTAPQTPHPPPQAPPEPGEQVPPPPDVPVANQDSCFFAGLSQFGHNTSSSSDALRITSKVSSQSSQWYSYRGIFTSVLTDWINRFRHKSQPDRAGCQKKS
jgi:hypothetical protein